MISKTTVKRLCCEDISKIENYDKAAADQTQTWHCHHRRETIYTRTGLIEIGEYYNRPAAELIFLTKYAHHKLHRIGKTQSAATRDKIGQSNKGKRKGMRASQSTRSKMSQARTGHHWYNNGLKEVLAFECPAGFTAGRLVH